MRAHREPRERKVGFGAAVGMVVLAICSWTEDARAHGIERALPVLQIGEILIPDLRLELASSRADLNLSWPVHVALGSAAGDGSKPFYPWFTAFGELQWVPRLKVGRVAAGVRTYLPVQSRGFSLVFDTAGVTGDDGSGLITGIGFGMARYKHHDVAASFLVLMYRCNWFVERPRLDLSLDLVTLAF